MSGGSLDYVCYKVDDAIDTIEKRATTVLQKAFAKHLMGIFLCIFCVKLTVSTQPIFIKLHRYE